MPRPNWPDDVETVAKRVLDGNATPEDAETLALWTLQVAKFIRIPSDKEDL